jgi:hypothetical protein
MISPESRCTLFRIMRERIDKQKAPETSPGLFFVRVATQIRRVHPASLTRQTDAWCTIC